MFYSEFLVWFMEHIKKLLSKRIKQSGFSQQVKTSLIIEEFNKLVKEILGLVIYKKIKVLYIKDKVIFVACLSSATTQELNFKKKEIIEKINKEFKEEVLKELRFVL